MLRNRAVGNGRELLGHDHRRSLGGPRRAGILGIGHESELSGARVFDAGNAGNFGVRRTIFQPSVESGSNLSKFHRRCPERAGRTVIVTEAVLGTDKPAGQDSAVLCGSLRLSFATCAVKVLTPAARSNGFTAKDAKRPQRSQRNSDQPEERAYQVHRFQNRQGNQQGLPQPRTRERGLQFTGMGMRRRSFEQGGWHSRKPREWRRWPDARRARPGRRAVKYLRSARGTLGRVISEDQRANCIEPDFRSASTGAEVSCRGGRRSGATRSARLRSRELHHMCPIWSLISSPTSTGRDSNSSGGKTSGLITFPRFVKLSGTRAG